MGREFYSNVLFVNYRLDRTGPRDNLKDFVRRDAYLIGPRL
jgi:hypothetical protein